MEDSQYPKLLSEIPPVDIVVTRGCNVHCPMLSCKHRYDWGLDDPTEKADEAFIYTIREIEKRVNLLRKQIENQEITI